MSFFVTEEVIYKIKSETDIVSLISEFVELKKSGSNFIGKCPFHNDKSPSFIVSPEKRIFRCFGCGESGDVISFLMKKQNMTFIEALEYLGEKIGVSINKNENYVQELKRNKLLYKINYDAMQFYYRNILIDKKPKEYIKSRQIGIELVNKFRIGYAGPMWDDLYKYLTDKGYNKEDMLDLGLILKNRSGGYYDRFRNRLMFPIFNIKNNIIGFGGRTIVGDKIKYMNSPDSCIFHKGENLYGLNELCKGKNSDKCILVEGYMDVIALFKNGFDFAVASLGTAFTKQQAKLIAKKCRKIFICYDGDDAGIKAASKAIDIFGEIEIYPKVVRLPDGLDPDEYIKLNGRDMFSELLENAVSTNTYKLSLIHAKYNLNNEEERLKYITEVSEFALALRHVARQVLHVRRKARHVGHVYAVGKVLEHALVVRGIAHVHPMRHFICQAAAQQQLHDPVRPSQLVMPANPAIDVNAADRGRQPLGPHQRGSLLNGGGRQMRELVVVNGNVRLAPRTVLRQRSRSEERRVGKECRSRWSPYH